MYPPNIATKAHAAPAAHGTMFKAALRIGVPIALGTDPGVYPHGMNGVEFGLMTELGMSPLQRCWPERAMPPSSSEWKPTLARSRPARQPISWRCPATC